MKKYFLIIIFNLSIHCTILNLAKIGFEQCQYIVNGQPMPNKPHSSNQHAEKQYEIIKPILKMYQRPFTMLDIGPAQGYHSLKAAWDFPYSVFVMLKGNSNAYPRQGDSLLSICMRNTKLNNIIYLNKSIYRRSCNLRRV